ncbi:MAG TPA: PASTA domain-containing protein [bacterium]|nr:PASTA domain-containing protein [bacterium]
MTIKKLFFKIVGITLGGILFIFLLMRFTGGREVEVPDIRGKEVTLALEELGRAGLKLNLKLLERRFDDRIPKDHIISQDPRSGKVVQKGREIKVIISRGSQKVFVPEVKERGLRSAGIILRQRGLRMGKVAKVYSDLIEEDTIMAQSLEPEIEVNRSSEINLLVSLGPYPTYFYMPDLIGRSLERASRTIEYLSLQTGSITYEVDPELREGVVLNQAPSFGFPVKEKSLVNLVISVKSQTRPTGLLRYYMLHYVVPAGLFSKRIKIVISDAQGEREVYNALLSPGKEINEVIAIMGRARAKIYIEGKLEREMTLR